MEVKQNIAYNSWYMFVPTISHRYMYFIITMHLLNDL